MITRLVLALLMLGLTSAAAAPADQDITLPTATGTLSGSIMLPAGSKAAAVLIAGSGPTDRNGNSGLGLHSNMFELLAQGLAARGIATLRFDKRGIGQSAGAATSEADLRIQTYADDAEAWAAELRKRSGLPCVWLIGHSEGALITELVAQADPNICGLVLTSGPGRKLGTILRTQLEANPANPPELKKDAEAILASLESGKTVTDVSPVLAPLFRPSVQPYLISEINLDPANLLRQTTIPVLILQGDNDIQVSMEDAKLLAAADPKAKLVILSGMNHLLKQAPADRAGNIATYTNPSLPLADGVVDNIATFLK